MFVMKKKSNGLFRRSVFQSLLFFQEIIIFGGDFKKFLVNFFKNLDLFRLLLSMMMMMMIYVD